MLSLRQSLNRRRFLGVASAATAGVLVPGTGGFGAQPTATPSKFPATDHFWYRPQTAGPYIDSQCDNWAFGFADGKVFLSEDDGRTWPHSIAFSGARHIVFSCILKNGNVLFGTPAKLYLSTDKLRTYRQITVKDTDGTDYLPHTPKNANRPGWYFANVTGVNTWDVGGVEMLVWGNYCNVYGGAAPVNIYYSTDQGQTVKIAYSFGQNPNNRDDGSGGGGRRGTLLGNPKNPVICRHFHSVAYNPAENAFYGCTGDHDLPEGYECHWLRGAYDADKDEWRWKVIVSDKSNSRYKSGGINFADGKLYWMSGAYGSSTSSVYDRGIFQCDPADLANPAKHKLLFNPGAACGQMIIQDGVILGGHPALASSMDTGIIVSPDLGRTWKQYDLKEFGKRSPSRFHRKNGEGWFRVDLRKDWFTRAETMFIKPKGT